VAALRECGYFCFSVPNEAAGKVRSKAGYGRLAKLKAMGLTAGVADLVVWLPDGREAYLEVKTSKGRQSPKQRDFEHLCHRYGKPYYVVRSPQEALQALRECADR
jgi:hypothetical protein